jgi:antitoxin (DNA-binding transcriptional repressor) of toxin-antitoxin stability system
MATPQLSPGVLIREVDLTVGRADNVLDNIGAIAGPFAIGPIDEPIDITTENQLLNVFGKPISTDAQYEYWMSASSFLSYGGVLKVVRTDGPELVNANAIRSSTGVSTAGEPELKIKNFDDYELNYTDDIANYIFAAKNPGSWANNLKVCVIDDKADQILGITTETSSEVFTAVISNLDGILVGGASTVGIDTTSIELGQEIKCDISGVLPPQTVVTGISTLGFITISNSSLQLSTVSTTFDFGATAVTVTGVIQVGYAVTTSLNAVPSAGIGTTSLFSGYLKSIVTGVGNSSIDVKITSIVDLSGIETPITYTQRSQLRSFRPGNTVEIIDSGGAVVRTATLGSSSTDVLDWYDQQTIDLTNTSIFWKSIAPKPGTSGFAQERSARNDEIHVVIIDDTGSVTGIQGNLLEKHIGLSKALDSISSVNSPQQIWWKNYLALYSNYVYVGDNPSDDENVNEDVVPVGFSSSFIAYETTEGLWNQPAQNITFSALGNVVYNLSGGKDYSENGGMTATLGSLFTSYNLFSNRDEIAIDYLIMGPGLGNKFESQAKANQLISIANQRKDCVAVISPHRFDVVDVTNTNTQTNNIIEFFAPLTSSSYAVFDSGYKYTYDRFNNKFRYIPCNGDVAGLMVRTSIFAYPWFSPAGQQRGLLSNAIKVAYNPNKAQRDQLYPQRINSIINQPGIGILLYGDKTALGYASAFDRINVRRLFLTVEQALERTAQAQLFELNDAITRANFVNIVEPYLRDVQAKRGLYGFFIKCDESNNTPDIIDNNEFRADIFLKPAKSINYVTLTFVATRTGVSFEEVAGTV